MVMVTLGFTESQNTSLVTLMTCPDKLSRIYTNILASISTWFESSAYRAAHNAIVVRPLDYFQRERNFDPTILRLVRTVHCSRESKSKKEWHNLKKMIYKNKNKNKRGKDDFYNKEWGDG